ncbi:class I SAM-dependent methyltransferase [Spirosoma sp. BT702]|uniref:Class I SAM-dependent methyltransferase n=1 Tax=Spirosoma profusum TaxID=2771354 RepID=A0A926XUT0_9BACT|nr:class I SAM-dependent methyltransferase [Spirosoma profusum]MBD2700672.1 class I SAM-dependent methyltransferase [Spirosoma profusum]
MEFTGERYLPELSGEIACEHLNRYYFVINQLNLKNKTVLDIASGEGYGSNLIAQFAEHVYGVDISTEAINHAQKKYKRKNLAFIEGDATLIPLEDNSVDIVISFETIEHIDKHQEMIDEIKRVLNKDGLLIISSPDKLHYSDEIIHVNHFHVKELYGDEFKSLINKNFKNSLFFSQNIFVGSIITLDEEKNEYKKPLVVSKNGENKLLEPKYNLAISTDGDEIRLNYTTVNYAETNRIMSRDEFMYDELISENMKGQLKVYDSLSYRLGNLVIKPVKQIKNLISTMFSDSSKIQRH